MTSCGMCLHKAAIAQPNLINKFCIELRKDTCGKADASLPENRSTVTGNSRRATIIASLLEVGVPDMHEPAFSTVLCWHRTAKGSARTAPASPIGSSSSGELDCSAPNTPSYPRPAATFDWSFQADRCPFHCLLLVTDKKINLCLSTIGLIAAASGKLQGHSAIVAVA